MGRFWSVAVALFRDDRDGRRRSGRSGGPGRGARCVNPILLTRGDLLLSSYKYSELHVAAGCSNVRAVSSSSAGRRARRGSDVTDGGFGQLTFTSRPPQLPRAFALLSSKCHKSQNCVETNPRPVI